jgi:hypothetical protein
VSRQYVAQSCGSTTHTTAQLKNPRFHSDTMSKFLFDLTANLVILATLLVACHLCNLARPDLALNGGYVYRYGQFSTPSAFAERASAYALACALALYCASRTRVRRAKAKTDDVLVIRTSAYTESHLPM